jgi:TIR domain
MTSAPLSISYYSHPDDLASCETLDRYLAPLKQRGRIRTWHERWVSAGKEWQRERDLHLSTDHLLILFISPDFLASESVQQQIHLALHRHQNGSAVVIPILVRPCLWQETALKSLQILPRAQGALSLHLHPEELWQEVVEDLIHVINSIQLLVLVYAPEDRYIARRISRDIAEHIHRDMDASRVLLWSLDWNQSSSDSRLHTEARNAIRSASAVVLIATPNVRSSHTVQVQMHLVDDYRRPIVVIWARGKEWDHSHTGMWYVEEIIDARTEECYEAARATLLARLKQKMRFEPSSPRSVQFSSEPRNPYKGLQPFTANDTRDFFGRKALTEELATLLEKILVQDRRRNQHARLLAVVGASGSGKSSVVMAGLLPCLQEERGSSTVRDGSTSTLSFLEQIPSTH